MRLFAIIFALVIGFGMLGVWAVLLATSQVPEVSTEPIALGFHLAAEAATALTLIASGIGLALRLAWAVRAYLVACGMLLYTGIASPGHYAQLGDAGFVVMFGAILIGTLAAIGVVWRDTRADA